MTSVARRREHDDSCDYSDASQDIEHNNSGNDGGHESDYDSQGSDSEHSERDPDPENQEAERRVDDDEDRSNPQYIPKRGTFYEHDDRTAASGEESSNTTSETTSEKKEGSETPAERRRPPRKSEIINKWSHDKYNENEQLPKSRDELVAIYGYDIRNEDAPPHARRNRRYGRGPNKYTRTWEDEEAYRRQNAAQPQPRKPPNPEDFPELDASKKYSKKTRAPRPRSKSQPASNDSSENGSQLRRNASIKTSKAKPERPKPAMDRQKPIMDRPKPVVVKPQAKEKTEKLPAIENLTITASVFNNSQGQRKVSAAVAQQRPVPTDQKKKPTLTPQPQNNAAPNKSPPQQAPTAQQQHNAQAPAGAESRGGSKRYSSLRQRPLAETYSPQQQPPQQQAPQQPQQQQQIRYSEYPAGAPPPASAQHQGSPGPQMHPQQQLMHQVHRTSHGPSPPHQQLPQQQLPQQQLPQQQLPQQQLPQQQLPQQQLPQQQLPQQHTQQHSQQVRLGILEQQQLVSHQHHSMHNLPQPHSMGQLQPTQGYAPPAMMPAQYMQPASGGGGVNFNAAMYATPPAPYPHQMYPHHNYQATLRHSDLAVPLQATQAGGVTYYSCGEQEPLPRPTRRPTAAIPIVRPNAQDRPANSTEKDNIDRIVENMFVRKPWPVTHGGDSKEKSENRSSQEPQSKDTSISLSDSLTSSSMSTDSKPSDNREEKEEQREEDRKTEKEVKEEPVNQESISTDA